MPHHMRGRHKVYHTSPAPKRPIGERISDGLSRLVRTLFWLGLAYAAYVQLTNVTGSVVMPNGAILRRWPDLKYETRVDMYRPGEHKPVVQAIEFMCYNDRSIWVTTYPDGEGVIWPSIEQPVITRDFPDYMEQRRRLGLSTNRYYCDGYYKYFIGAEMFFAIPCPVKPDIGWPKANPNTRIARDCSQVLVIPPPNTPVVRP